MPLHAPLSIEVFDATRRLPSAALAWLTTHIEKAVKHLGAVGEVRVRIVDDPEMAKAHEEFAGVAGTTDVLTFDLSDPEEAGPPPPLDPSSGKLGFASIMFVLDTDILVCLDQADRHVKGGGGGTPPEKELLLYVLHGILHCLGMDDHDPAAFEAMHRAEDAVLQAIGVGPVFMPGPPVIEAGSSPQAAPGLGSQAGRHPSGPGVGGSD